MFLDTFVSQLLYMSVVNQKTIRICADHEEYPVPLLSTMKFPGMRYWCPFCQEKGDVFYGEVIPSTPELEERKVKYAEASRDYLDGKTEEWTPSIKSEDLHMQTQSS